MEDRTIAITTGTILKTIFFLAIAWALYKLWDVVLIVLTAIVIASAIEPGVASLMRRRIPRAIAVIFIYVLMLALLFGIFYFFVPSLLQDVTRFISLLPQYLATLSGSSAFTTYSGLLGSLTPTDFANAVQDALNFGNWFENPLAAATSIFGGVFSTILIIVFSFYFAVSDTGVDDFLRIVSPKRYQSYMLGLWRRSQHKIGLWMQGQLILGVIMGVLIFLSLTIFGVPHALVLAVLAACFEIIPVFGPTLAAVPAVAVAFGAGGVALGLVTIAIYVIAQQFENHLIYPQVVTRVVGVPPLLVILALIVGAELGGFLGIILSVPVAATLQELVRDIQSGRLASETGAQ